MSQQPRPDRCASVGSSGCRSQRSDAVASFTRDVNANIWRSTIYIDGARSLTLVARRCYVTSRAIVSAATLRHSRCIDSSPSSCVHVATRARRFITNDIYLMHVSTSSHRRLCRQQRGVARTRSARSGSRCNWWLGTSWKIYRRRELAKRRGVGRVCDPVLGVILGVILRVLGTPQKGGPGGVPDRLFWGSPGTPENLRQSAP